MTMLKDAPPVSGPSFEDTPLGGSHAASVPYLERRAWIGEYFDRTAAAAWATLTSDAPVSRVRATVRAGRDQMRATLLGWLPPDLHGRRVLDAGCGTGTAAIELARTIAKNPRIAVIQAKVALNASQETMLSGGLQAENEAWLPCLLSDTWKAKVARFKD